MKFIAYVLCAIGLMACVVEPIAPTPVLVPGYWYWHEGVRVWYPERYVYRPRARVVERVEIHRHYHR